MLNEAVLVPKDPDPVKLLLDRIPRFRSYLDQEDLKLPYVVFGLFAQYLLLLPVGDPILNRAVTFLNELAEGGDPNLENLVQVAVFESLVGDARSEHVKRRLCLKATRLFLAAETMSGTN